MQTATARMPDCAQALPQHKAVSQSRALQNTAPPDTQSERAVNLTRRYSHTWEPQTHAVLQYDVAACNQLRMSPYPVTRL